MTKRRCCGKRLLSAISANKWCPPSSPQPLQHISDAPWGEFKMEKIRILSLDTYGAYPRNNFNKPRVLQSAPSQPHTAYRFVGLPCVSALPTQKPKQAWRMLLLDGSKLECTVYAWRWHFINTAKSRKAIGSDLLKLLPGVRTEALNKGVCRQQWEKVSFLLIIKLIIKPVSLQLPFVNCQNQFPILETKALYTT